ncbi:MAG TPA: DUF5069 domain-containing protein [Verrucomicrobiae bacterium]|nr:DUF5069 domain-containing protein [Verrucomicrobiae bacterium]
MKSKILNAPDLTQRPPRSPRVRLGGYAILARCLDKGRATLVGKNGEYIFACPLDQRLLEFAGIKANDLKKQLALGKSDGEILDWIAKHSSTKRPAWEIVQWSAHAEQRGPTDVETHEYFTGLLAKISKKRDDVVGWFDLLDLDDYVSFGGKA